MISSSGLRSSSGTSASSAGPLQAHRANEELLIVLRGTPLVRRPSGAHEHLEPGSVVAFPAGEAGAHAIEHDGSGVARLLVVSTMSFPDVVEHLESDTLLVMTRPPTEGSELLLFDRGDSVDVLREDPPGEPGSK
jgi:uncharacterized cupin superfamily protein